MQKMIEGNLCYWNGKETFDRDAFTKSEVYHAIEIMDGKEISGVEISVGSSPTLAIGGGGENGFICQAYRRNESTGLWLKTKETNREDTYEICQDSDVASVTGDYVVSLKELLSVLDYLIENFDLLDDMEWTRDHLGDFNPWE